MGILEGKTAIITGGTSGIGRSTAIKYAQEGASVIIVGRNIESGKKVVDYINKFGGSAEAFYCDLKEEINIIELKKHIQEKYSKIDILFNNAGVWITEPLENITEGKLDEVFSIDFNATLFMMKHFIDMIRKSKGTIINNASMGGLENYTNGGKQYMYCAAKAGVIKISKLAAKDNALDIRVNVICPGIIETDLFENKDFSRFTNRIPMGRTGKPEEVAEVLAFLGSDKASYINGAVINIDGGMSL